VLWSASLRRIRQMSALKLRRADFGDCEPPQPEARPRTGAGRVGRDRTDASACNEIAHL